ncbi:hypothetical protein [Leptospira ilyithenensis]|uniref:Alpha/beta hydrolase n=1 Tax=Leptospira ilyithenensis TaxID=2484901 RepID=A0A4R9LN83_9LEPT|nr:hypothetical protein [Leptospira ilyithenensis]TGN10217.1 hypothetical protein EHS11_10040 [Leptospira ilyithenensis]
MKYFKTILIFSAGISVFFCHVDRKLELPPETNKVVQCITNLYGISNLCDDEKEYLDWAKAQKQYKSLKDLTKDELQRLTRETLDVDKTSALFYLRSFEEPLNKKFIGYLDKKEKVIEKKLPNYTKKNILLAMVPGMFYKDNPTVGADGKALRDMAAGLGLKEDVIPVDQTGTVDENAKVICDYVKNRTDVNGIIFASVSKGSGDLKKAIQLCGGEDYFKKAKGWYNIGGLNKGTMLVDGIEDNWRYRWEARSYFFWKGYNYDGFLSMGSGKERPLDFDLKVPKHLLLINVIAVPQFRQVTKRAKPFYEYLIQYGPNDGMTLLADSYVEGAITYPSFRNDHYFQWPIYENRLRAFFTYIVETQFP